MIVRVRYFARLREIAGKPEESFELPAGADVETLFGQLCERHPTFEALRPHLRVAVNLEFSPWGAPLNDGDELAFIPPVSGGSGRFLVTDQPLSTDAVLEHVRRPEAGAITTFQGVVRDHTGDRDVVRLEYDAYVEMAQRKLCDVAEAAEQKWPGTRVAVHHRYGVLEVGEIAVVIAVSSPHRADSFAGCRFVIEELKREVPIWKKEVSADGSEWIGRGP